MCTQTTYLTFLILSFVIYNMEIIITRRPNEITHVNWWAECLAYSKCTISVSISACFSSFTVNSPQIHVHQEWKQFLLPFKLSGFCVNLEKWFSSSQIQNSLIKNFLYLIVEPHLLWCCIQVALSWLTGHPLCVKHIWRKVIVWKRSLKQNLYKEIYF